MNIAFDPYLTTNAAGSFVLQSDGLIVGTAYPDPSARFRHSGGWLALTETLPMWGGVGITENIPTEMQQPPTGPEVALGPSIGRATAAGNLTGFSVFDQNYAALNFPGSPVPQAGNGMLVNFYRIGSMARIALAIDPGLVSMEGGPVNAATSWDFTNQRIIAGAGFTGGTALSRILSISIGNSMVPVYDAATGSLTWNRAGAAAVVQL